MAKGSKNNVAKGVTIDEVKSVVNQEFKKITKSPKISTWFPILISLFSLLLSIRTDCNNQKYDSPMCTIVDIGCSSGGFQTPNRTAIIFSCMIINDGKRPLHRKSMSGRLIFPDRIVPLAIMSMPETITGGNPGQSGSISYTNKRI